jgi:hypothetical protein
MIAALGFAEMLASAPLLSGLGDIAAGTGRTTWDGATNAVSAD